MTRAARVFIKERTFIVDEYSNVYSGPFPGGRYKRLPSQNGKNANEARKFASGEVFNEGAYCPWNAGEIV